MAGSTLLRLWMVILCWVLLDTRPSGARIRQPIAQQWRYARLRRSQDCHAGSIPVHRHGRNGTHLRKKMVGHSSDAIHDKYTHLELELQAVAIGKLGSVLS
jgi:hypothetical protein